MIKENLNNLGEVKDRTTAQGRGREGFFSEICG